MSLQSSEKVAAKNPDISGHPQCPEGPRRVAPHRIADGRQTVRACISSSHHERVGVAETKRGEPLHLPLAAILGAHAPARLPNWQRRAGTESPSTPFRYIRDRDRYRLR